MWALATPEKSTTPRSAATIYPFIIPIKNGITLSIPFPLTAKIAVLKNATKAII